MKLLTPLTLLLVLLACKRRDVIDPCSGVKQTVAQFTIKEIIGDTAFAADTIFRNNPVIFEAATTYDSVKWTVGNDPRSFTKPSFNLLFTDALVTIPVRFTGYKKPATACFPGDMGVYAGEKRLTSVEQFERAILTKSPMIGRYKGAYIDAPSDTFTVRIEYFDSAKYNTSVTGAKNFYWISNFPKGYRDSTSSTALRYPELTEGIRVNMGFKALNIDYSRAGCCFGYAWLVGQDSLYAYSGWAGRQRHFKGRKL